MVNIFHSNFIALVHEKVRNHAECSPIFKKYYFFYHDTYGHQIRWDHLESENVNKFPHPLSFSVMNKLATDYIETRNGVEAFQFLQVSRHSVQIWQYCLKIDWLIFMVSLGIFVDIALQFELNRLDTFYQ